MDCTIDIDVASAVATVRLTGLITVAEAARAFERLAAHPQYRDGVARLWNVRKAEFSKITSDDIRQISQAARATLSNPRARVALLVARDVDFGISRMYQSTAGETLPMQVFRDLESAEAWLRGSDDSDS